MPKIILALPFLALTSYPTMSQEHSTWWHGSYVSAGSQSCEANDSLTVYGPEFVQPWETSCSVTQQTEIRDMQGVLLDLECGFPDSEVEAYKTRLALFKLRNGNMLEYSSDSRGISELQLCPTGFQR